MIELTLTRRYFAHGTFGTLTGPQGLKLVTVERPWVNNQRNVSCVPEGIYTLRRHNSPTHGECFALEAVTLGVEIYGPSQRTHILIHSANTVDQLEGCIAPGLRHGVIGQDWAVLSSKLAMDDLLGWFGDNDKCRLVITRA